MKPSEQILTLLQDPKTDYKLFIYSYNDLLGKEFQELMTVLADALEEEGDPSHQAVRWMLAHKKRPYLSRGSFVVTYWWFGNDKPHTDPPSDLPMSIFVECKPENEDDFIVDRQCGYKSLKTSIDGLYQSLVMTGRL